MRESSLSSHSRIVSLKPIDNHATSTDSVGQVTVESFDQLMAVNARGTMLCYKHAAKQMIAQGRGGRIIGAYPSSFLSLCMLTRGIHQVHVRKLESKVTALPLWSDESSRVY